MKLNINSEQRQTIRRLQAEYMIAKAEYVTIKQISDNNSLRVLADHEFFDDNGNRVLEYDWRIEGEEQFNRYLELLFIENKKSGLWVDDPNKVPWADAWKKLKEVEKELLRMQLETLPEGLKQPIEKAQRHWKYRDECIDLMVRLAI